ncbi:glycosyltransferase family 39 protein [Methanospirillum sp. J.3.6.1-F.2.7.3]|uniref:Glycosyltransferase family 39 protein n=1 Tax=Methanospirillum purgamenti TaxID=2834276 RepID=A0A8E7AYP9_9EURY|nr:MULTISPECIES: glycosyltransferase family 39 protein [Methanospirillum]MDX8549488.1 glycosyltransferase family 39 protein [Methanospirillum hungatei]QVV89230.1 glycosyltransferase family 39 protein [Methanospirillum sp. J.3.6.1-F.2.7.3]
MTITFDESIFKNEQIRMTFVFGYGLIVLFGIITLFLGLIPTISFFFVLMAGLYIVNLKGSSLPNGDRIRRIRYLIIQTEYYYWVLVMLTVILTLILRLYNLTALYPYHDEWAQISSAWRLAETGFTEYFRAYYVTNIERIFFDLFGRSIFIARLPCVFFGALSIIPLFLLIKRVSYDLAIITIIVWATDPFSIVMTRHVREYAFYPFFIFTILLLSISIIDSIFYFINEKRRMGYYNILSIFLVGMSFVGVYLEEGTVKFFYLIIPGLILYSFFRFQAISIPDKKRMLNKIYFLFVVLGIIFIPILLNLLKMIPKFQGYFITLFFGTEIQLWLITLVIICGLVYFFLINKNHEYLLLFFILFLSLYVLSFHWDFIYLYPRYGFYAYPFLIFSICAGLLSIYVLTTKNIKTVVFKKLSSIILLISIILLFNPIDAINTVNWNEEYLPVTDDWYPNMDDWFKTYQDMISSNDIIITTYTGGVRWMLNISPPEINRTINNPDWTRHTNDSVDSKINLYIKNRKDRYIYSSELIQNSKSGWLIIHHPNPIDKYPLNNFIVNDTKVMYHGKTGIWGIYSWGKVTNDTTFWSKMTT